MSENCGNCHFWKKIDRDQDGSWFGPCRRNPPVVAHPGIWRQWSGYKHDGGSGWAAFCGDNISMQPTVDDDDWCGKWKPAAGDKCAGCHHAPAPPDMTYSEECSMCRRFFGDNFTRLEDAE